MKAPFLRFGMAVVLLIASQTVKAQSVITEYFDVRKAFKVDLNDKNAAKSVYTKGVLDIDWNKEKGVLAISYDPKLTKIEDIMGHISSVEGGSPESLLISINNKAQQQYAQRK